jgi:RsiW-degrading membrane proteinase PrsW (M82 family)
VNHVIIGVLIAILIPLLFLYAIWAMEIFAFNRVKLLFGSFAWGLAAFAVAFLVQSLLVHAGILSREQVTLYSAPVLEEILKATGVALLAYRMRLRYAVEGASYGFASGTGFAVAENLLYLSSSPDVALEIALTRVLSVSLMHAFATALVGAVLGGNTVRGRNTSARSALLALGIAIVVHGLFNQIAQGIHGLPLIVAAITIGIGCMIAIGLVIHRTLMSARRWIDGELNETLASAGERAAACDPQRIAELLAEHRDVIDGRRAEIVNRYVRLLAQRAILAKTRALNQRPSYVARLQRDLQAVDEQIALLRGEMGLFMRTWLRSVLPSEESTVWHEMGRELNSSEPLLQLLITLGERQAALSSDVLQARIAVLRATPLFGELAREELEDIALLLRERRAGIGDDIVVRGQENHHLYITVSGSAIGAVKDGSGGDVPVTAYRPHETFGEVGMIDGKPSPLTITSYDDTLLYTFAREDFVTLVYAKPQVGFEMMRQLAERLRQQSDVLLWVQGEHRTGELFQAMD